MKKQIISILLTQIALVSQVYANGSFKSDTCTLALMPVISQNQYTNLTLGDEEIGVLQDKGYRVYKITDPYSSIQYSKTDLMLTSKISCRRVSSLTNNCTQSINLSEIIGDNEIFELSAQAFNQNASSIRVKSFLPLVQELPNCDLDVSNLPTFPGRTK